MENHPIESLMLTAMSSIENMVDVNTIVGEPIETSTNVVIIPISKVCFGFAAGGSEFKGETIDEYTKKNKDEKVQYRLPFGGGSGASVSIHPVAFLIVEEGKVRLLPVTHSSCLDKILDYVPDLMEKLAETGQKIMGEKKQEEKNETEKENLKNGKRHLHQMPKTTEEKLAFHPNQEKEKQEQEMAKELEELLEDEYEYEDD